jgi:hypothetical protein
MSNNIWDDSGGFRDSPVEYSNGQWKEAETYAPVPETHLQRVPRNNIQAPVQQEVEEMQQEDIEELTQQVSEEDDEDYTEVLSDARLRLEQGKLYEMVMQHDLFSGLDSDPRAVKSVQKQIRKFAQERMEIMLGMKQEKSEHEIFVSSPFNDLEVTILKKLASAASKGATESVESEVSKKEVIVQPKKTTLNSIGPSKPKVNAKPIQKKAEPIQRVRAESKNNQVSNKESGIKEKSVSEMNMDELAARNVRIEEQQKNKKAALPPDRLPQPTYETMEMLAANQVQRAVGNPKGNLSAAIMAALNKK